MLYPKDYAVMRVAEEQRADRLQRAEICDLLCQADVDQRGWFACQLCRLMSRLGHRLVLLGRRLEQYNVTSTATAELHFEGRRNIFI